MAFWNEFEERAARLPGVDAAGLSTCAPLSNCHTGNFYEVEGALPRPDGKDPVILWRSASAGYFPAMGFRLKGGRFLAAADAGKDAAQVVVVNEAFVRTFWGEGANGVGRRIRYRGPNSPWNSVVGVTGDVKHYGLERPVRPGVYFPLGKQPRSSLMMTIHSTTDPRAIAPSVRELLRQMDPEVPLVRLRTMEEGIRQSMALRAAWSWMLAVFATLAFVLAIGGAYGVAMYLVTQSTREIGIRVALGARTRDIMRNVVASGVTVVLAGVACGLAASVGIARLLGDALFGVSTIDAAVLSFVTAVLVVTALLANGLPARRAARIDPLRSLRTD